MDGSWSSGAFAILGAIVGGYFTSRAATSTERLRARATGLEALRKVMEYWRAVPLVDPELRGVQKAEEFHRSQEATMFLAGIPFDVFDGPREGQRLLITFREETMDPETELFSIPNASAAYIDLYEGLAQEYLVRPRRAWLRNHSPKSWRVRRALGKSLEGANVPAIGNSIDDSF